MVIIKINFKVQYSHLPAHLQQQLSTLPTLRGQISVQPPSSPSPSPSPPPSPTPLRPAPLPRAQHATLPQPPLQFIQYVPPAPLPLPLPAPAPAPPPHNLPPPPQQPVLPRQIEERWIQEWLNRERNQQQAQRQLQQLQHSEEVAESHRRDEERELIRRQQRLEGIASNNNSSIQALADYQASNPQEVPANDIRPPSQPPFQPVNEPQALLQPPPPPVINQQRNRPPRGRMAYQEPAARHSLGPMNKVCPHCHALHFDAEKLSTSTRNALKFGMCCLTGQINLPPFPPPPQELLHLFDGTSTHSLEFKTNIRRYNATFAFTSLGAKIDHSVVHGTGPYSFRISGELHHQASALLPPPD